MSGEDLTIQPGLALQQDLALVSLLGLTHVERNGHHYVNGMAGLSQVEQDAFLAAHPDLYERSHGAVRVGIATGRLRSARSRVRASPPARIPIGRRSLRSPLRRRGGRPALDGIADRPPGLSPVGDRGGCGLRLEPDDRREHDHHDLRQEAHGRDDQASLGTEEPADQGAQSRADWARA